MTKALTAVQYDGTNFDELEELVRASAAQLFVEDGILKMTTAEHQTIAMKHPIGDYLLQLPTGFAFMDKHDFEHMPNLLID